MHAMPTAFTRRRNITLLSWQLKLCGARLPKVDAVAAGGIAPTSKRAAAGGADTSQQQSAAGSGRSGGGGSDGWRTWRDQWWR